MAVKERDFDPQFKVSTATSREILEALLVLAPDDERDFHCDHVPIVVDKKPSSFTIICCCGDELMFDSNDTFALGWDLEEVYQRLDRLGHAQDWKERVNSIRGV